MGTAVINWFTNVLNKAAFALGLSHRIVERRKSPRTKLDCPLAVLNDDNQIYRGVCRDISKCGLGAIVYGELRIHQNVRLKFAAVGRIEVNPRAVVRNRYGSRYGFEFVHPVDLSPETSLQD